MFQILINNKRNARGNLVNSMPHCFLITLNPIKDRPDILFSFHRQNIERIGVNYSGTTDTVTSLINSLFLAHERHTPR